MNCLLSTEGRRSIVNLMTKIMSHAATAELYSEAHYTMPYELLSLSLSLSH